jgi:methanethiol S-methyltransferase
VSNTWSHILLGAGWASACAAHSIFAGDRAKAWARGLGGSLYRFYRLAYNGLALLSFGLMVWALRRMPSPGLWEASRFQGLVAGAIALAGLVIMAVSIQRFFLSFSGIQDLKGHSATPALQTDGLYRFVRHPLYLGTFLFIWALFLFHPTVSNLMVCLIITGYTLIGMRLEERKLVREFGQAYVDYQRRVPAILPIRVSSAGIK